MNTQLFADLFQSLSEKQKSDYLFSLLEQNTTIRVAFIEHFESLYEQVRLETEYPFSINESIDSIIEKAEEVAETFGELDFEDTDWSRWNGSDHYVPDYEIAHILADEEASEAFENFGSDLEIELQTGNLTDIIGEFTGVFHGIICAEISDPNNDLSDDPKKYFLDQIDSIIEKNQNKLTIREFSERDYKNALELAFRFNQLYYSDKKKYIKYISKLLIIVLNNKSQSEMVWELKEKYNFGLNIVPKFLNKVTKLLGDNKIWIESLESCFLQDYDSSIELMEYYLANDNDKFENAVPKLWAKFMDQSLVYLLERIRKGTDFHLSLLKKHSIQKSDCQSLDLLKSYISDSEIEKFIDSLDNNNTKALFYSHQKYFDKLVNLINTECIMNQKNYYTINFDKAVVYLFADRPTEAWEMIKKVISRNVDAIRSRDNYANIAKLLKTAGKITGIDSDLKIFTANTYNHKPNLSALKDEFRKAGLF